MKDQTETTLTACNLGSGIGRCGWGSHIALLYRDRAQRDALLESILNAPGASEEDRLLCLEASELDGALARSAAAWGVRLESSHAVYHPNGVFDAEKPEAMFERFDRLRAPENRRSRPMRGVADMGWASTVPGGDQVARYEHSVNRLMADKPWVGVCCYDLNRFDGRTIMDVLRTHPWVLDETGLVANPFFVPPTETEDELSRDHDGHLALVS